VRIKKGGKGGKGGKGRNGGKGKKGKSQGILRITKNLELKTEN